MAPVTIDYVSDSEFCIASFQYVLFIFFNELAIPKTNKYTQEKTKIKQAKKPTEVDLHNTDFMTLEKMIIDFLICSCQSFPGDWHTRLYSYQKYSSSIAQ